ncbi:hypothetical protein [Marinactinospora rubrisoli]|uniref:Uncharacterized protein n=1 Tax=Marinactinospora rubrisoli TaxID=2715399 RepID=A0ABW2KG17_9ACTN
MSDRRSRVTIREIRDLLQMIRDRHNAAKPLSPAEEVALLRRKAEVLSRIAADSDDLAAHEAAREACAELGAAIKRHLSGGAA